jgi:PAS domain S-box-containing protein
MSLHEPRMLSGEWGICMSKFGGRSGLLPKSAATIRRLAEEKARASAVPREHLKAITREEMQDIAHELRVHQLQLEMQNEELRRVQDELESSRSQYVELYDMAPTGYFTVSEKALILEVNLTGASILGTPRTELLGKCFSSFISKGSQNAFYLYRKDLAAINERRTAEIQMVKHDGAVLWALCSGSVSKEWTEGLHADSSKETVFHLAISDITAGKRDAELLHEGNMRFRELFKRHGSVMLVIEPESGNIVEANDSAVRFYGWSAEELKTMTIMQINDLPPEVVKEEMAKATRLGKQFFEFRHKMADGSMRDVEVFSSRIDTDGKDLFYSVVVDVTERKRSEAELRTNKALQLEKKILE